MKIIKILNKYDHVFRRGANTIYSLRLQTDREKTLGKAYKSSEEAMILEILESDQTEWSNP
jgi:hypothetical protein